MIKGQSKFVILFGNLLEKPIPSSYLYFASCVNSASLSDCALDMATVSLGTTAHYDGYNDWRVGDTKLDW